MSERINWMDFTATEVSRNSRKETPVWGNLGIHKCGDDHAI